MAVGIAGTEGAGELAAEVSAFEGADGRTVTLGRQLAEAVAAASRLFLMVMSVILLVTGPGGVCRYSRWRWIRRTRRNLAVHPGSVAARIEPALWVQKDAVTYSS